MIEKQNNLRRIEAIMKLMQQYRVNVVDVDGVRIEKVYHDPIQHETKQAAKDNPGQNNDFWIDPLGGNYDKYPN